MGGCKSVISTADVTSITTTSATGGGNITNEGTAPVTARGLVWSTTENPTVDLTTKTNDGSGTGSFTSNISGLSINTTYYVRSYATNANGTAYGNQVSFTTSNVDISTGLVGYWPFNGNADDESGNGNNGTVNGATLTDDRFGNANKAYSFDGVTQFIDIPIQQKNIYAYSIIGWFYFPSDVSNGRYRGIVQASGTIGYSLSIQMSANPTFNATNSISASINGPGVFNGLISNKTYNDNNWHFFAATYQANSANQTNSSQIFFYIDGALINSSCTPVDFSSQPVPFNGSGNTKFGRTEHCCDDAPNFFEGKLDDIRIYNRALTQEEITYLATH